MADNSPLLKWLATITGATNVHSAGPIANPTDVDAVMFSVTAPTPLFVHRITIVNDSTIPEIYILQSNVTGNNVTGIIWKEVARITVEPGLTWRGDYTLEIPAGVGIRIGIQADPAATGNSWTHFEYLESSAVA